jgi:hypothetical protein
MLLVWPWQLLPDPEYTSAMVHCGGPLRTRGITCTWQPCTMNNQLQHSRLATDKWCMNQANTAYICQQTGWSG